MNWTCACEAENSMRLKVCSACGTRKPKSARLTVAPREPAYWVPRGPRPCTDVENAAALQIVLAVIQKKMTVAEAEEHLHTIFQGRELP